MFFNRNCNHILAVDLAPDAVHVIELTLRGGQPLLDLFAQQSLAEGPTATLPERHMEALASLVATHRLAGRRTVAALPTSMVLTRTISLDKAKPPAGNLSGEASVHEQILWTLSNCLPFDPRDLVFDHWPIPTGSGDASGKGSEVLVVATQTSVVEKYLRGFQKLGLTCMHLDVAPCAIASLLARTAGNPDAAVGTISLTSSVGFFAIAERGRVLFWRPFELPGKAGGIHATLDRVGDEISKCISHMVGAMHMENLAEMLIFGNGAGDMVVSEYLKNRFHVPVRAPSPFEALPVETGKEGIEQVMALEQATHFATAAGLALQHRLAA